MGNLRACLLSRTQHITLAEGAEHLLGTPGQKSTESRLGTKSCGTQLEQLVRMPCVPCDVIQNLRRDLAVHAVSHPSMARYAVSKVLDLEASLEATGKKASKRRDDGGKRCQHHSMKLHSDIEFHTNAVP